MSVNGRGLFRNQFHRHCPILDETARIREILASVAKIDMTVLSVILCHLNNSLPL